MDAFKQFTNGLFDAAKQVSSSLNDNINSSLPGRRYQIRDILVEEERQVSEGGFAFIWLAKDVTSGKQYVLKKIVCHDKERVTLAEREVAIFERLPPHSNIVQYYGHSVSCSGSKKEFVLLLELLAGGHLLDLLNRNNGELSESQIVCVMKDIAVGLVHLHSQNPPVQHRDIKIENVLADGRGKYVIVDLGSWSDECADTKRMSRDQLLQLDDSIERYTTLMYRPPEMTDLYRGFVIDTQVDIWMLGCVLFTLLCNRHPFQDESKLAVANARFHLDSRVYDMYSERMIDLLYWLLCLDPKDRPTATELVKVLESWHSTKQSIPLPSSAVERKEKERRLYGKGAHPSSMKKATISNVFQDAQPVEVATNGDDWAKWDDQSPNNDWSKFETAPTISEPWAASFDLSPGTKTKSDVLDLLS